MLFTFAYTILYLPLYTIGLGIFNRIDHKPFFAHWQDNFPWIAGYISSCVIGDMIFTEERQKALLSRIPKGWMIGIMIAIMLVAVLVIILLTKTTNSAS